MTEILQQHRVFSGSLSFLRHDSAATGTSMKLSVFQPPGSGPFPLLVWLSGLTCTEENFTTKAGAYAAAARIRRRSAFPERDTWARSWRDWSEV